MGRGKETTEAAVCSASHRRLVFCLWPAGPAWAASPPDCQHGVDASAQATRGRQRGWGLLGGPWAVSGVWPVRWLSTERRGCGSHHRAAHGSCYPAATLRPICYQIRPASLRQTDGQRRPKLAREGPSAQRAVGVRGQCVASPSPSADIALGDGPGGRFGFPCVRGRK